MSNETPSTELTRKEKRRAYSEANREKIRETHRVWVENNELHRKLYNRQYARKNAERLSAQRAADWAENKEALSQKYKDWRLSNKEQRAAYMREWRKNNPGRTAAQREKKRSGEHEKMLRERAEEAAFKRRLSRNLRSRIRQALVKGLPCGKKPRTEALLGCTMADFRAYMESLFQHGMSWENYGARGWHIDHIRPLASFDLSNPEELLKAGHYTNLQPLWAFDNQRKSDKWINPINPTSGTSP